MPKRSESEFFKKVKKIVADIKKGANGKRCGDCQFYQGNYCGYDYPDWEKDVAIETPDAVACPHWEAKEERRK
jgi:hypothetical protein